MPLQAKERTLASEAAIELAYAAYMAALIARGPRPAPELDLTPSAWRVAPSHADIDMLRQLYRGQRASG